LCIRRKQPSRKRDIRSLAKLLLIAGNETTTNLMANAMRNLCGRPAVASMASIAVGHQVGRRLVAGNQQQLGQAANVSSGMVASVECTSALTRSSPGCWPPANDQVLEKGHRNPAPAAPLTPPALGGPSGWRRRSLHSTSP